MDDSFLAKLAPGPEYDPLLRQIGGLLLAWGHLERSLNWRVVRLQWRTGHKEARVSDDFDTRLKSRLTKWRRIHAIHGDPARLPAVDTVKQEITTASTIRHNICHGFHAVSSPTLQAVCSVGEYARMMADDWRAEAAFYPLEDLKAETLRAERLSIEVFRLSADLEAALDERHKEGG